MHSEHGIRRTGSFITLLLSMLLMMPFRSVMSLAPTMPTWMDTFKVAWEFWAAQHGLQSRATSRHDYYQESWTAFQKYYGETSWECLEEIYAAVASAFLEACPDERVAKKVLHAIRQKIRPVELLPEGRDASRSRSPRRVQVARYKRRGQSPRRTPPKARPARPRPKAADVPGVPDG